jgi:hypothetical protein
VLEDHVSACDVMLALIGPKWLTATDEMGRRRLDNPLDFVRIEIDSALRLGKRVIPVLVHKTEMPEPLRPLARRNAVWLTRERFRTDAQGLIKALKGALADAETARQRAAKELVEAEAAKARSKSPSAKHAKQTDKAVSAAAGERSPRIADRQRAEAVVADEQAAPKADGIERAEKRWADLGAKPIPYGQNTNPRLCRATLAGPR